MYMNLNECLQILDFTMYVSEWVGSYQAVLESNEGEPVYLGMNGVFRPVRSRGASIEDAILNLTKMISGRKLNVEGKIPRQMVIPNLTYKGS